MNSTGIKRRVENAGGNRPVASSFVAHQVAHRQGENASPTSGRIVVRAVGAAECWAVIDRASFGIREGLESVWRGGHICRQRQQAIGNLYTGSEIRTVLLNQTSGPIAEVAHQFAIGLAVGTERRANVSRH